MQKRNIFISHYSGDAKVARQLKTCIGVVFLGQPQIFLSEDLQPGANWFSEIATFLKKKPITIVIATHESIKRPWVWFEVGASWNAGGAVIPVCCKGMTLSKLPDPLGRLTATNLTQKGIHILLNAIAKHSGCTLDMSIATAAIKKTFGSLP